jgi:hypothetical protein
MTQTHETVTLPQYGYVANPSQFFTRAFAAAEHAEQCRAWEARLVADLFFDGSLDAPGLAAVVRRGYERRVAASAYADAVYQVESAKLSDRNGMSAIEREMYFAVEAELGARCAR